MYFRANLLDVLLIVWYLNKNVFQNISENIFQTHAESNAFCLQEKE